MALPFDIVVTTCHTYFDVTTPVLLASMREAGVPMERVHIVKGQAGESRDDVDRTAPRVHSCEYTAEALTALVYAAEHPEAFKGWVLLLQDTMTVGLDFVRRALEVYDTHCTRPETTRCVKLLDKFSLSVGFYHMPWVRTLDLTPIKRHDADEHVVRDVKMFIEDWVFDKCPNPTWLGRFDNDQHRRVLGWFSYAPGAARRMIEHYPVLDVCKLKSWYGQVHEVGTYTDPAGAHKIKIPVGA